MSKTKKIIILILAILICIGLTIYNAIFINTKDITVRKETITSNKIDSNIDGLIIAYFSDLHYGTFLDDEDLDNIENKINNFSPDIVIFGGDLFDEALDGEKTAKLENFLRNINAKYGKYAVLGDKDNNYYDQVNSIYNECDFRLLNNTNEKIYLNGSYINLVGVDSSVNGNPNVGSAYDGINSTHYTVAITHCPDEANSLTSSLTDYILAGHSLGGQVYIPLINLFYRPSGATSYYHGKDDVDGVTLDITNGLGTIENDIRLNADAEIVIYKLKKAN